jgi:hypothetical protein
MPRHSFVKLTFEPVFDEFSQGIIDGDEASEGLKECKFEESD